MEFGIQVSSLRPLLQSEAQVREAFRQIGAMGCRYVQLQWVGGDVSPELIADVLAENEISSLSVQDFFETILHNFDYFARLNQTTGGLWMCVSRIPERLKSREGLDIFIRELRSMQARLEPLGQRLCFHPVSGDYTAVAGMDAVVYLLEAMPELAVCLDLFHLNRHCEDMPGFIRRYGSRICMVHFKDSRDGTLVPAGQGDTHWEGVMAACLDAGVPYGFAEQETWEGDPYAQLGEALAWMAQEASRAF